MKNTVRLILVCVGTLPGIWTAAARQDRPFTGVVVESVETGGAAEKAGLRAGDTLLSWERAANPPANPKAAKGKFETPFDVIDAEIEQAPRGRFEVAGLREGKPIRVEIPPGKWQLKVRPALTEKKLMVYRKAIETLEAGDAAAGIALLRGLIGAAKESKEPDRATWLLFRAAEVLEKPRKWDEANGIYAEAAQIASALRSQADIHEAAGEAFKKQNRFDEAAKEHEKALAIREKIAPESLAVAASLNNLGLVIHDRGDLGAAREYYQRALTIREDLAPESLDLAVSLNNLGVLAYDRGDLAGAEAYYKRSLAIKEKLEPGSLAVAMSFNNLGNAANSRGDLEAAEAYYDRALAVQERLAPGSLDVAKSLNNLGVLARKRGDLSAAEEYYKRCLAILQKIDPESLWVAMNLNNLGTVAEKRGNLAAAERYYQNSLAIKEKLAPGSLAVAMSFNNLGNVADARGDLDAVEIFQRRALEIQEKLAPESLEVARSLRNLGIVAQERGDLEAAETFYRRDLEITEKLAPGSLAAAESLINLGTLNSMNLALAEDYYQRALAIQEKLAPGSLELAMNLYNLGLVVADRGDLAAAEGYHQRALSIFEKLAPGSSAEAHTSHALGGVFKKQGPKEKALVFYRRAVNTLETQRGRLGGGSAAAERFSAKYADYYRDLAELEAELGQKENAFETMERFRGRALVEMLAERDLDFSKDAPGELLLEQKRADFEQRRVLDDLAKLDPTRKAEEAEKLLAKLREVRARQGDITERIKKASPRLASLQYPEPLGVPGARKAFGPETLFLSYCVGEERTLLFALLGDSFEIYTIAIKRKEIESSVRLFRKLAGDPGGNLAALEERAVKLYDLLLKPAAPRISKAKAIVICPDGPLYAPPFSALRTGKGKWLAEEKPLSFALSATLCAEGGGERHAPADGLSLAAFGDPAYPAGPAESLADPVARWMLRGSPLAPLPATRREIEALRALYPETSKVFLGESATEGAVKSLGKGTGAIHLACHGIVDERFPLESALALSIPAKPEEGKDNGLLQAWEIFESLRIDADLVTLSACETGLGKEMGGEGLVGLTRAFQYAGARSVLSSLWSVSDESTAELMKRFYGYLKQGKPKAEALRLAQLDLIHSGEGHHSKSVTSHSSPLTPHPDYSHPFFWAAFVLNGDAR